MAMIEQIGAYEDCTLIWQRAVETPGGIRVPVGTFNDTSTMQMRMNKCRSILRRISKGIYPPGDRRHNTSEFDTHMVQVRGPDSDDVWWIYVRPHGRMGLLDKIEPISETEPEVLADYHARNRERAMLEYKPAGATRYEPQPISPDTEELGDPDSDLA